MRTSAIKFLLYTAAAYRGHLLFLFIQMFGAQYTFNALGLLDPELQLK